MSCVQKLGILTTLAIMAGCATATEPFDPGTYPTQVIPRLEALPRTLTAGEQKLITASNDFSFSLFQQLNGSQKDSNTFVSPLTVSMALGMALTGASAQTYSQMRTTLGLTATSDADVGTGYKSLLTLLQGLDPTSGLRESSALWYRSEFPVNQGFIDAGANSFYAQVSPLDFASPSATATINSWVTGVTQGKINSMINGTNASQRMLLMDAVSFKGTWREPFDTALTGAATFRGTKGAQLVRMMTRGARHRYYASDVFEAVDLPYGNDAFSMTIALPRAGKSIETVAASIREMGDAFWSQRIRELPMQLFLPRFRIEWDGALNDDMKALGMTDAFSAGVADFTRMSSRGRELALDVVKQRSFVDVDEDGTEAAALVHVPTTFDGVPFPLIMFVDRPFMVVIRERLSGTIIFLGKVMRVD